jgi:hypothetical protein
VYIEAGFILYLCILSVCDSLADGKMRKVREGDRCECKDGWTGINCNSK